MTTARARLLAQQARDLAAVRPRHDAGDPLPDALVILASTIEALADQLDPKERPQCASPDAATPKSNVS